MDETHVRWLGSFALGSVSAEQFERWIYGQAATLEQQMGSGRSLALLEADYRDAGHLVRVQRVAAAALAERDIIRWRAVVDEEREACLKALEALFASAPAAPRSVSLCDCGDCRAETAALSGKSWPDIGLADLRPAVDNGTALAPEAWPALLPAFLNWSLREWAEDRASVLTSFMFKLTPVDASEVVGHTTAPQLALIRRVVHLVAVDPDVSSLADDAETALRILDDHLARSVRQLP